MPYPMPGISFGGFLHKCKEDFGVVEHQSSVVLTGPRGPVPVIWLERQVGEKIYRVPKPELEDDDLVALWLIENMCRRLRIDKKEFGLHLD